MREIRDSDEVIRCREVARRVAAADVSPVPAWLSGSHAGIIPVEPRSWHDRAEPIAGVLRQLGVRSAIAVLMGDGAGLAPPCLELEAGDPAELAAASWRYAMVDWAGFVATGIPESTWALFSTEWYELWAGPPQLVEAVAGGTHEHACAEFLRYACSFTRSSDLRAHLQGVYRRYCGETPAPTG